MVFLQDKMAGMIDKLRLDLGIPQDNELNKIEFGYGSVSHSEAGYYFYNRSESDHESCCPEADNSPTHDENHGSQDGSLIEQKNHLDSSSISNNNESHSTDSGKQDDCGESTYSSDSSLSASETEIREALLQVGLNSKSTTQIVEIMTKHKSCKNQNNSTARRKVGES